MRSFIRNLSKEQFFHCLTPLANQEGFSLLLFGSIYNFYLEPIETIITSSWSELAQKMRDESSYVGYLCYEMGAMQEVKSLPYMDPQIPLAYFQKCAIEGSFDYQTGNLEIFINESKSDLAQRILEPSFWNQDPKKPLKTVFKLTIDDLQYEDKATFVDKVKKAKEYILEGEVYQVNLAHQIAFRSLFNPFELFKELIIRNPTQYSAYLNVLGIQIISLSPELLIKKSADRVFTRPIKGTIARGKTLKEDEERKLQLITSEKERAELLMITDLMRNDLGRIAIAGSVEVQKLFHIESYSSVHHLVSYISAKTLPHLKKIELVQQLFPGGSISGCPKLRAIDVIYELEKKARGIYTGSLGHFRAGDDLEFNIAIRTMVCRKDQHTLYLGSGIVMDSVAELEYEETLHKGKPFFDLLGINL